MADEDFKCSFLRNKFLRAIAVLGGLWVDAKEGIKAKENLIHLKAYTWIDTRM